MVTLKYYKFIYSLILLFMFSLNSVYCMNQYDTSYDAYMKRCEDSTESNEGDLTEDKHQINIEDKCLFLSYIINNNLEKVREILERYPSLANMQDPISPVTCALNQDNPEYEILLTLIEFGCDVNPIDIKQDQPITYIINKTNKCYEYIQLNILIDILNLLLKNEAIVTEEMILLANENTVKQILSIYFYEEKETSCQCSLM